MGGGGRLGSPDNFFLINKVFHRGLYRPPSRSNWTPRGPNCFSRVVCTTMDGSRKFCQGGGGVLIIFIVIKVFLVFLGGLYVPPYRSTPEFLRKHITTCDFPEGGFGPHVLPKDPPMYTVIGLNHGKEFSV